MTTRTTGEVYEACAVQFEPELFRAAQTIDADFGGNQSCKVFMPPSCMSDLNGKVGFSALWDAENNETTYELSSTSWPHQVPYNRGFAMGMPQSRFRSLRGPLLLSYEQGFTINPGQSSLTIARSALFSLMGSRGRAQKPFHSVDLTMNLDHDKLAQQCAPCTLAFREQECLHETEATYWRRLQAGWDVGVVSRLLHEIQLISRDF